MPETNESASPDASARAMDEIATAIAIVTARARSDHAAQTVRGVIALGDAPGTLVCGIDAGGALIDVIRAGAAFRVNLLATGDERSADAFLDVPQPRTSADFPSEIWTRNAAAGPALRTSLATFTCTLQEVRDLGGHAIVIGRIAEADRADNREPLLFLKGDYRRVEELPLSVFPDFAAITSPRACS